MKIIFVNPERLDQIIQEELDLILERRKGFGKLLRKAVGVAGKAAKTATKKTVQFHRAIKKRYKRLNRETQTRICETIVKASQSKNPEEAVSEVLEMFGYNPLNLKQVIGLEVGLSTLAMLMQSIDPEGMRTAKATITQATKPDIKASPGETV